MQEILDEGIKILYAIVRDGEDAEAREDQKEAVRQIKRLAKSGDPEAVNALERLRRAPDMHPFLREIVVA
jgi:DNA-directed RNA polymerase subunit F